MSGKPPLLKQGSRSKLTSSGSDKVRSSAGSKRRGKSGTSSKDGDEERESVAYKILPAALTQELLDAADVLEVQGKLVEFEKLQNSQYDLKEASVLDYFVSGVWWCREQQYECQVTSAVYTVLHTLLDNVQEKHMNLVENMHEFKKMFAGIGIEGSDVSGGLQLLDAKQARDLMLYVHSSFFKHYKLYEYIFSHTQAEEIIGTDLAVEVAKPAEMPWPPPLDEGVPLEIYNKHIATPPPTPPLQEEEVPAELAEGGESKGEEADVQNEREAELLATLSAEEIKEILSSVANEMLGGLQTDIASKLKEREASVINRINKIHRIDSS